MERIYQSYSDNELLLLIAKDDEQAFRVIYDRYWKRLLVQAILKLHSPGQAEEIVQTVFINLWRRRHTIQLKFSFHTYVASMLKYEVLHQLAANKKENNLLQNVSALHVAEDNSTRNWLEYDQLCEEIEKTVQSLPEKCQLVFRLSRENGLTEKQIAETLDIAPKTVQAHMSKALKQLRTSLQQLFYLLSTVWLLIISSIF